MVKFKPLDKALVETVDVGVLATIKGDASGLKEVRGGDTERAMIDGADTAEVIALPLTNGVGAAFSSVNLEDDVSEAGVEESAFIIGMSLIFGEDKDDDEDKLEFECILPNPRLT